MTNSLRMRREDVLHSFEKTIFRIFLQKIQASIVENFLKNSLFKRWLILKHIRKVFQNDLKNYDFKRRYSKSSDFSDESFLVMKMQKRVSLYH